MDVLTYQQPNVLGHPMEDFCLVGASKRSFAVADGVTREKYSEIDFPDDLGASQAARLFCESAIQHLETNTTCDASRVIHYAFDNANQQILMLNKRAGILERLDFLRNDYFSTVGAAAFLCDNNHLHYGYVGDCHVRIIGSNNTIKFETSDQVDAMKTYLQRTSQGDKLQDRKFLHSSVRNNPFFVDEDGNLVGYGVFTGEQTVAAYYRFGDITVQQDDLVFLHTDGVSPFFSLSEFLAVFQTYVENRDRSKFYTDIADIFEYFAMSQPKKFGDDKALIFVTL